MSNYADCLLIVGGKADDLDFFEHAPSPSPQDAGSEAYFTPEIVRPSSSGEEGAGRSDSGWPRMLAVPVEAPVRAYLTTTKYSPPHRWLHLASMHYPQLRFALLWIDDVFDQCGLTWLQHGDSPVSFAMGNEDYERFTTGCRGWRGSLAAAVVWVEDACPPGVRASYAIVEELLDAFLPSTVSVGSGSP